MFHVLLECKAEKMCTIVYYFFAGSSWLLSAKRDCSERYFMSSLIFFFQQPVEDYFLMVWVYAIFISYTFIFLPILYSAFWFAFPAVQYITDQMEQTRVHTYVLKVQTWNIVIAVSFLPSAWCKDGCEGKTWRARHSRRTWCLEWQQQHAADTFYTL